MSFTAEYVENLQRSVAKALAAIAVLALLAGTARAETIKIGLIKQTNTGLLFLAQERGYFAAEGFTAELINFDWATPIAVAVTSGDLDFGVTALTAGFYTLAGQGSLRIIAGQIGAVPGFQDQGWFVSGAAYAAGVRTLKDIPGHTVAVTQIGASSHYALGLAAEKYGFDLKSVKVLALQSMSNIITALTGGRADFSATTMAPSLAARIEAGDIKVAAWVGDETPWQFGSAFTSTKTANERHDVVERFLRAYRKGARDFHDAFTDAAGKRADNPRTAAAVAVIARYTGQSLEQVNFGVPFIDPEAKLDVKDVLHQIAWYRSQGMMKGDFDAQSVIDMRYVVPLP